MTVFRGRVGDHNDEAMVGAQLLGHALAERVGQAPLLIGTPERALNIGWELELAAARPGLRQMAARLDTLFGRGQVPLTVMTRCAVAIATLPVVARHHPEAVVVWFDAHADLNTPDSTESGYLGGLALSGPIGMWDTGHGEGVDPRNTVLVGVRDIDPAERRFLAGGSVQVVSTGPSAPADLQNAVSGRPIYVHIDCDVLEPGLVPTDYRIPDGYGLAELGCLAEVLASNSVLGLEIAEFEATWRETGEQGATAPLLDALDPLIQAITSCW